MSARIGHTKLGLNSGYVHIGRSLGYSHTSCRGGLGLGLDSKNTHSIDRTRVRLIYGVEGKKGGSGRRSRNRAQIGLKEKGRRNFVSNPTG